jgi:hypothetical protein
MTELPSVSLPVRLVTSWQISVAGRWRALCSRSALSGIVGTYKKDLEVYQIMGRCIATRRFLSSAAWSNRRARAVSRPAAFGVRMLVAIFAAFALGSLPAAAVADTTPVLAVSVVGPGSVSSHPAGIACPGKCSASFAAGATVVLTAMPRGGSSFLRWGGACTGTGQCTVKVTSLVAVAAQFLPGAKPQPVLAKAAAVPGSYTARGSAYVYGSFSFFVAPGARSC